MASERARSQLIGLSLLAVDRESESSLRRQLVTRVREAIANGELRTGSRLPSTRAIADALEVSRNTVADVFAQLVAEGVLVSRHGSGTYVAPQVARPRAAGRHATAWERASLRGRLLANADVAERLVEKSPVAFQLGIPALDHFPFDIWARIAAKVMRRPPPELVSYGDPAGYRPLREAIAAQVRTRTGIPCRDEQIVIVGGSQQAQDLVCRLALDPGDEVWVEDPASRNVRASLLSAGASLVPVPVDDEGLAVGRGRALAPCARMAFVTSAHQWPLGPTLSPARRRELLAWAHASDAWIVEDEYDGVFRYDAARPEPLAQMDADGRVIYVGSFSVTTFPALRIGYLVAPLALVDAFVAAKATADRQSSTLEQAALAEFMYEGHYVAHLARMQQVYAERRGRIAETFGAHGLSVTLPPAGLHALLPLDDRVDDVAVAAAARAEAVVATALSRYYAGEARRGLLLGFGLADAAAAERGARTIAGLLQRRPPPRAARDVPG